MQKGTLRMKLIFQSQAPVHYLHLLSWGINKLVLRVGLNAPLEEKISPKNNCRFREI